MFPVNLNIMIFNEGKVENENIFILSAAAAAGNSWM